MPKRTEAIKPFSLRDETHDYAIYRTVYVSCGNKRCRNDRHGPYMYKRKQGLDKVWRETYIGSYRSPTVQELLRRIALQDSRYGKYLITNK